MDKRVQGKMVIFCVLILFGLMIVYLFNFKQGYKTEYYDIDNDGIEEEFTQKLRTVSVKKDGELCWQSEQDWKCDDFLVYDIDSDGKKEFLVLLWKKGIFGEYKPFWMEENKDELTQRIFIYRWNDDEQKIAAVWMSSKLIPEIKSWDMTEDGKIHIVTMSGEDTLWIWGHWGLERIDAFPEFK